MWEQSCFGHIEKKLNTKNSYCVSSFLIIFVFAINRDAIIILCRLLSSEITLSDTIKGGMRARWRKEPYEKFVFKILRSNWCKLTIVDDPRRPLRGTSHLDSRAGFTGSSVSLPLPVSLYYEMEKSGAFSLFFSRIARDYQKIARPNSSK